jgi:hypothetical protein
MKLDVEEKKVLVQTDQVESTKGKNVIVSDELHNRMIKPRSPQVGVWKENVARRSTRKIRPTYADREVH